METQAIAVTGELAAPRPPGYWRNETGGSLIPAIKAYVNGFDLTVRELLLVRAYLRQWIGSPVWKGQEIAVLREKAEAIKTREDIDSWLDEAMDSGIDPL